MTHQATSTDGKVVIESVDATHFYYNGVLINIPEIEVFKYPSGRSHDYGLWLSALKAYARDLSQGKPIRISSVTAGLRHMHMLGFATGVPFGKESFGSLKAVDWDG